MVADAVRTRVFARLRKLIGIKPTAILGAAPARLQQAIRDGGMQPARRAAKVQRCAEIAVEKADGDLKQTLKTLPPAKARALLRSFPGIAGPGADKVLLLCGFANSATLDSNGIRVLARLGYIAEETSYSHMYRAGVAILNAEGMTRSRTMEAFAVLREHGRELCKRSLPLCAVCPLQKQCAYAASRTRARRP